VAAEAVALLAEEVADVALAVEVEAEEEALEALTAAAAADAAAAVAEVAALVTCVVKETPATVIVSQSTSPTLLRSLLFLYRFQNF
jgi:hypothetical protein